MPINDPILYYTMDTGDISGTTITDRGSGGNNGTLTNSPTTGVPGKIGQAMQFNETDDCVDAGTCNSQLAGITALTAAFWVNFSAFGASSRAIISKWGGSLPTQCFLVSQESGGHILFAAFDGSDNYQVKQTTPSIPSTGDWHHVACVFSAPTTTIIYFDGTPQSLTSDVNNPVASLPSSSTDLTVGCNAEESLPSINGSIDEVPVYNRALSPTEVTALYNFTGGSTAKPWVYAQAMRRLRGAA
jgi:hypothetical protein